MDFHAELKSQILKPSLIQNFGNKKGTVAARESNKSSWY